MGAKGSSYFRYPMMNFPRGLLAQERNTTDWPTLAQELVRCTMKKSQVCVSGREKAPSLDSSSCCNVWMPTWALQKDTFLCKDVRHFSYLGLNTERKTEMAFQTCLSAHHCPTLQSAWTQNFNGKNNGIKRQKTCNLKIIQAPSPQQRVATYSCSK